MPSIRPRAGARAFAASTALAACASFASAVAAQSQGAWSAPFDHELNTANTNVLVIPPTHFWPPTFNAIHMSLVPCGPHRGSVLVWDKADVALRPYQRWALVDPTAMPGSGRPRFRNFFLTMPTGAVTGDLFCASHVWMRDGRLFVAGGTATYPSGPTGYRGAALCYQFAPDLVDPANGDFGLWKREPDLAITRWYPSAVSAGDDAMIVAGGTDNGVVQNDYEVYRLPAAGQNPPANLVPDARPSGSGNLRAYAGPTVLACRFSDYPRLTLLTNGQLFMSGFTGNGVKWTHVAAQQPVYDYTAGAGSTAPALFYGATVLDPRGGGLEDKVLRIGGLAGGTGPVRAGIDWCRATVAGNWQIHPAPFRLVNPRWMNNAIVLPNGEIFVFGGWSDTANPGTPVLVPELLTSAGSVVQPQHAGSRGYHATGVLLPDGRVLIGGGDIRSFDYQIYTPPYLVNGRPRPLGVACDSKPVLGGMRYLDDQPDAVYTAWWDENLPAGVAVAKVVLVRPGTVTHHGDHEQRLVQLQIVADDDVSPRESRLRFLPPRNSEQAPRGWYMLFLVTNEGVPSEAAWINLQ